MSDDAQDSSGDDKAGPYLIVLGPCGDEIIQDETPSSACPTCDLPCSPHVVTIARTLDAGPAFAVRHERRGYRWRCHWCDRWWRARGAKVDPGADHG